MTCHHKNDEWWLKVIIHYDDYSDYAIILMILAINYCGSMRTDLYHHRPWRHCFNSSIIIIIIIIAWIIHHFCYYLVVIIRHHHNYSLQEMLIASYSFVMIYVVSLFIMTIINIQMKPSLISDHPENKNYYLKSPNEAESLCIILIIIIHYYHYHSSDLLITILIMRIPIIIIL